MDTIYYHLNARKIKVSGGADLVTFVPVAAPAPTEARGEVLDFALCRRHLETKAAWQDLARTAAASTPADAEVRPEPEAAPAPAPTRRDRAAERLELWATAAVIAAGLAATLAFLRLL